MRPYAKMKWPLLVYLDDTWVSERLVQDVHLAAELQSVDDEVLVSGGDLHQRRDAQEAPVGVVLEPTERENAHMNNGHMSPVSLPVTPGQANDR